MCKTELWYIGYRLANEWWLSGGVYKPISLYVYPLYCKLKMLV